MKPQVWRDQIWNDFIQDFYLLDFPFAYINIELQSSELS